MWVPVLHVMAIPISLRDAVLDRSPIGIPVKAISFRPFVYALPPGLLSTLSRSQLAGVDFRLSIWLAVDHPLFIPPRLGLDRREKVAIFRPIQKRFNQRLSSRPQVDQSLDAAVLRLVLRGTIDPDVAARRLRNKRRRRITGEHDRGDAAFAGLVGVHSITLQFLIFAIVSIGLTAASRTIFVKYFSREKSGGDLKSGVEGLPGKVGTVVTSSRGALHEGAVKVFGSTWTAYPVDGEEPLEAGDRVEVIRVQGASIYVRAVQRELPGGDWRGKELEK
jgi:membrane protein implicated in regulation of membrane protease activity